MSMNVQIKAERDIFSKRGEPYGKQVLHFDVWQTSTKVSYEIMKEPDAIEAYKDWVMSITEEDFEEVYAEDDPWGERKPIGAQRYHRGEEHCAELDKFVSYAKGADYKIIVEVA